MTVTISRTEIQELSHKDQVRLALFCSNQVKDRWKDNSICKFAIELVESWLDDKVTTEYIQNMFAINTWLDSRMAPFAIEVVKYVVKTIYYCDHSDIHTQYALTYTLNHDINFLEAQRKYYNELRYIDENFERIVLEGSV